LPVIWPMASDVNAQTVKRQGRWQDAFSQTTPIAKQ
jgi:hypothetical protein